jgi:hypothetical protein
MDMEIDTEGSGSAEVRVESDGGVDGGEESRKRILISNPLKDPYVSCFMRLKVNSTSTNTELHSPLICKTLTF